MNNEHIIEMFKKTFVGAGKYPKRISDPILADDISDFIEEALNSQKEEIVKSIKQYKVSSPSLGGGGEELYTDNLSKEEEKIDDLLDEICQEILFPETLPDLHRSPRPEKCKHDYLLRKDLKTACVLCGEEPEEWESRFDKKFPAADYYLDGGVKADIKSFIKTEIRKAEERTRQEICRIIEKEMTEYVDWDAFNDGKNQPYEGEMKALQALLEALKK